MNSSQTENDINCTKDTKIANRTRSKESNPSEIMEEPRNICETGIADSKVTVLSNVAEVEYTYDERLKVVQSYHNVTHNDARTMAKAIKREGKFDWRDLEDLVTIVDQGCWTCERNRIEKLGYHPLTSIRSAFVGDIWESHKLMCDHGCPKKIIHDKGGEFVNKHVKEVCAIAAGIMMTGGSPCHPQTQGSNERRHLIIRNLNKGMLLDYVDSWEEAIPTVQMKLNLGTHRKHNSTPFVVYY
eukprot:Awhi_evm2s14469